MSQAILLFFATRWISWVRTTNWILRDGEAALRFVDDHRKGVLEPEPCVILLDLYLPRYDGLAVIRAIRQAPTLQHIQVVVLTALASPTQQIEIAAMGGLYRKKPSALNEVMELAAEIMAICESGSRVPASSANQ
jgi:CheY-like chemotaxis protein